MSSPSLDCVVDIVGNGLRLGFLDQQFDEKAAIVESQYKG